MNKWDLQKLRSFCKAKDTVIKTKRHLTEWENIFTNPTSDKGLISKIYKELKKLDFKILIKPLKNWGPELNRKFSTEEVQMAKRHLRSCSTSVAIREMQINTTLRYMLTPVSMAKIKNTNDNLCWRRCGVRGTLIHCWWDCKLVQSLFKSVWRFFSGNWESTNLRTQQFHSWVIPERCLIILKKNLFNYVHNSTVCNSQNLKTT